MILSNQMVKLIRNEMIKNILRVKTIIFIIVLIIFTLIILKHDSDVSGNSWKQSAVEQISSIEKIDGSSTDVKILKYCIEKDIPCNYWGKWKYFNSVMDNIGIIVIYMVAQSATVVADEYMNGTIYQLFVSPFRRWKIWLAKYVTIILMSCLFVLVMLITSFIVGTFFINSETNDYKNVIMDNGNIVEVNLIAHTLNVSIINVLYIVFISTIAFMLSSIFRKSTIAIIASILVWVSGAVSILFIKKYWWFKLTFIPHLKLDQYLPGGMKIIPEGKFSISLFVVLTYLAVFIVVSLYFFCEKDPVAAD